MPFQAPADGVLLPPYRILDLTGPEGVFCGKLLADYGAEVIKVEPPAGDPARQRPPFIGDEPGLERSSYFLFYNTNKRSVTMDIESPEGQDLFKKLAASADVIIESFSVGYMEYLGLDFDSLKTDNPGLIMAKPHQVPGDSVGWVFSHDATTLGGNSGSLVLTLRPDIASCGLHFGGSALSMNLAHDLTVVSGLPDGAFLAGIF